MFLSVGSSHDVPFCQGERSICQPLNTFALLLYRSPSVCLCVCVCLLSSCQAAICVFFFFLTGCLAVSDPLSMLNLSFWQEYSKLTEERAAYSFLFVTSPIQVFSDSPFSLLLWLTGKQCFFQSTCSRLVTALVYTLILLKSHKRGKKTSFVSHISVFLISFFVCFPRFPRSATPQQPLSWATTAATISSPAWCRRTHTRPRPWWTSSQPWGGITSPRSPRRATTERVEWRLLSTYPGKLVGDRALSVSLVFFRPAGGCIRVTH